MERYKYPRTLHLPWSPSVTPDDKRWDPGELENAFAGKEVVVTEKMDGESTTIYSDCFCHARSVSSGDHPSRHWMKGFAYHVGTALSDGCRACGENLYAAHSIAYDALPSYFLLFGLYTPDNLCMSWDQTVSWALGARVKIVPVLYRGEWKPDLLRGHIESASRFGKEPEGFVVRTADGFPGKQQPQHTAKWVRSGHVQTDEHWMQQRVVPNGLVPGSEDEHTIVEES